MEDNTQLEAQAELELEQYFFDQELIGFLIEPTSPTQEMYDVDSILEAKIDNLHAALGEELANLPKEAVLGEELGNLPKRERASARVSDGATNPKCLKLSWAGFKHLIISNDSQLVLHWTHVRVLHRNEAQSGGILQGSHVVVDWYAGLNGRQVSASTVDVYGKQKSDYNYL